MDIKQKQLIDTQMQKIPAEVRAAIAASDWERIVFNIGRAHKLHVDDIDILSIETILTMIGLEHPQHFPENVQKRIGLSDDTLMDIVDEINEKLFSKIREALRVHYEKVSAGEIMAEDEKEELYHAGVDLGDGYVPQSVRKTPETFVDQKVNEAPVVSPPKDVPPAPVETTPSVSNPPPPPKVYIDPYREPIE